MPLFFCSYDLALAHAPNFGMLNLVAGWVGAGNIRFLNDPGCDALLHDRGRCLGVGGVQYGHFARRPEEYPTRHYYEAARPRRRDQIAGDRVRDIADDQTGNDLRDHPIVHLDHQVFDLPCSF